MSICYHHVLTAVLLLVELRLTPYPPDPHRLTIELDLVVQAADMLSLSHRVQKEVIRAMDKLVGLRVDAVNVHIEDVAYPDNTLT